MNSLAMISSIIGIECRGLDDGEGRAALERVRSRLAAVSNLYRILGGVEVDSVVDPGRYLRSVTDAVAASVGFDEHITVEVSVAPCELTTGQAAALGLITNEAMTNAYKHAFLARESGRIEVSLRKDCRLLTLAVKDDGCGMSDVTPDGLGTTLIKCLAADLGGDVTLDSDHGGTCVSVHFPRIPREEGFASGRSR